MNPNQKQENLETPSPTQRKGGLMKKNTFDNNILLKSYSANKKYFYIFQTFK